MTFSKNSTKLNASQITQYFNKLDTVKSRNYRKYNQAFYEEILIDYNMEQRIAQNYREKFINNAEEVYLVLEMYAKNDYISHFLKTDLDEITID